jgi:hypothetical protein
MSEKDIPDIHLFSVKYLAFRYGIPLISGVTQITESELYQKSSFQKIYTIIALLIIVVMFAINSRS